MYVSYAHIGIFLIYLNQIIPNTRLTVSIIKLYFLFTEVKLKVHDFYKVKITNVLFQRKKHPKAVVHRCSTKKLFRKISLERLIIGVLFY